MYYFAVHICQLIHKCYYIPNVCKISYIIRAFLSMNKSSTASAISNPKIPNHHTKLDTSSPGTCTFIPNEVVVTCMSTTTEPMAVKRLRVSAIWLRMRVESKEILLMNFVCDRESICSALLKWDIMVKTWSWMSLKYEATSEGAAPKLLQWRAKQRITSVLSLRRWRIWVTSFRYLWIFCSARPISSGCVTDNVSSVTSTLVVIRSMRGAKLSTISSLEKCK